MYYYFVDVFDFVHCNIKRIAFAFENRRGLSESLKPSNY